MNKRWLSLGICAALSFFAPSLTRSAEIDSKLQAVIERAAPQETIPIILVFAGEAELGTLPKMQRDRQEHRGKIVKALRETADLDQKAVRTLLQSRGRPFEPLWIVNGLAVQATPDLIAALAAQPRVARIAYDEVVQVPAVLPAAEKAEWNIAAVHAPELWDLGINGHGVTVAIVDSGVDVHHPDLAGRYLGGPAGWYDPYRQTTVPYDPDGHGTLVAGVIVGGSASGTAIGVAPGARWIAAKIFRDDGTAENSQILKALQWLLDPDGNPATADAVADVVNNSWGFEEAPGICDSLFRPAIQNLRAAGMTVVFAAGNTGPAKGVSPGNYAESLAVGATNPFSLLASFSARGPSACDGSIYPDLVAPGMSIRSSAIAAFSASGYASVNGTSFSAPHVTGVMALLLSAAPGLPPDELERILKASAADLGAPDADNEYGFGMVNALAALQMVRGTPDITVDDTAPPADDLRIDFGHVPPGQNVSRTVTVRNSGQGLLHISGVDPAAAPFAISADRCVGRSLAAGQTCSVEVQFAPRDLQPFASSLVLYSSDPDQGFTEIRLTGVGNTVPAPARPAFPARGAREVALPVTVEWTQVPDADGDPLRHTILVAEREDFSDATAQSIATAPGAAPALLAGAGGCLLLSLLAFRRRHQTLAVTLLAACLLLAACGGGGSDSPAQPQGEAMSATVAGLDAGTHYYWKIVTEDTHGASVESEAFSFTTKP